MPFSIEQIKGAITAGNGLARGNLFNVDIPIIPGVSAGGLDAQSLNIMCKNITLPGRQLLTKDKVINGFPEKVAYAMGYEDVTVTFAERNDYLIRRYFTNWHNYIFNQSNGTVKYKNEYTCDISIRPVDRFDVTAYGVKLFKAFPTQLTNIDYNNEADNFVEVSVTFTYQRWDVLTDDTPS